MNPREKSRLFMTLGLSVMFIVLFIVLRDYIVATLSGLLLAYVFSPVYRKIYPRLKNKYLASGITIFICLLLIVIPFIFVFCSLVSQAAELINIIDVNYFIEGTEQLIGTGTFEKLGSEQVIGVLENPEFISYLENVVTNALSFIAAWAPSVFNYFSSLLIKLFVAFLVMFFVMIERDSFLRLLYSIVPVSKSNKIKLEKKFREVTKTVIYGQILVALAQGFIGGLGFLIFGVSGAVLWGFVMAVFSLVPFVGTFVVWFPAVIYLLIVGKTTSAIGLFLYSAIIVGYTDNILRMKIFNSLGKLHPLTTMFGLLFGLSLFGIIGLILGPILFAFFVIFLQLYQREFGAR